MTQDEVPDAYFAATTVTVTAFGVGSGTVSDHTTCVLCLPTGIGGGPLARHAGLVGVTVPPGWAQPV